MSSGFDDWVECRRDRLARPALRVSIGNHGPEAIVKFAVVW